MFIRAVVIEAGTDVLAASHADIELQLVNRTTSRIGPPAQVLELHLRHLFYPCRTVEELSELTVGDGPFPIFPYRSSLLQNQREWRIPKLQGAYVRAVEIESLLSIE